MAAELLDEKSRSLSVEIPKTYVETSSSVESSLNPSPTGILSESRSTTASTSSLQAQLLSVTFAPLPKLAPRKRRSTAPLGMAARGQLVRRRRGYGDVPAPVYNSNPMWTDEEIAEQQQLETEGVRREGGEGEDPFVALGKMVKVASKTLWRKVSHKDLSKKKKGKADEEGNDKSSSGIPELPNGAQAESRLAASGETTPIDGLRNGLAPTSPIDKKEDDEERFLTIGQTETIVEGHTKYSWASENAVDPGLTPTGNEDRASPTLATPSVRRSASM